MINIARFGRRGILATTLLTLCVLAVSFNNCSGGYKPLDVRSQSSDDTNSNLQDFACESKAGWEVSYKFKGYNGTASQTFSPLIFVDSNDEIYVGSIGIDSGGTSAEFFIHHSTDHGATWRKSVVENGLGANSFTGFLGSFGNGLYLAGSAVTSGSRYWVVYRSQDKGQSWSRVLEYQGTAGDQKAFGHAMGVDSQGSIYSVGGATLGGRDTWIVRKSATGLAGTWNNVDAFNLSASSTEERATSFAKGLDGTLYVGGFAKDGAASALLRRSSDNGATWTTIDNFQVTPGKDTYGGLVYVTPTGTIFFGAAGIDATGTPHWIIRRSLNNGTSWSIVDDFTGPLITSAYSSPHSLHMDAFGNLYATAFGDAIRMSFDGGTTWTMVSTATSNTHFQGLGSDSSGNIFSSGSASAGVDNTIAKYTVAHPQKFSETCLAKSTSKHLVSGTISEFTPKYELWSDGAEKKRWIYLPKGSTIDNSDNSKWKFPVGTQIWKEFSRDGKKIETRLLIKVNSGTGPGAWEFVTYKWRADGTDAILFLDGEKNALLTQHDIVAVNRCTTCHAGASDFPLGLDALQLSQNNKFKLNSSFFSNPSNQVFEIQGSATSKAALGYIHANCGSCHNPNGSAKGLGLNFSHNLDATSLETENFYIATVNKSNLSGSIYVSPKNSQGSLIRNRMSVRTPTGTPAIAPGSNPPASVRQMPSLGTDELDPLGLQVIENWIHELP